MLLCLIQTWSWGVPHPDLVGGHPGYPPHHPDLVRGVTPSRPGWGAPQVPLHHPDLEWGTLLTWDGVPTYLDLGWGTPLPRPEMGYPPYPDLRWGTPPPRKCELTNKLKTVPSPILWMRAVMTLEVTVGSMRSPNWTKLYENGII